MKTQQQQAAIFQELHTRNKLFILPNAWDAGSAKIFEKVGYEAIATTSAGIAYSLGYADGEIITIQELLPVVRQIAKRTTVPLSVDMERGYGETPEEVTENVRAIIAAGAVGINIEDGYPAAAATHAESYLEEINTQVAKIEQLAALKDELNIPFVINARSCAYWLGIGDNDSRLNATIERCNAYVTAGADCIFIPGVLDKTTVTALTNSIAAPLNIIANPAFNDIQELQKIGVRRLSLGSGPVRATYATLMDIANTVQNKHDLSALFTHPFSYQKANEFFE